MSYSLIISPDHHNLCKKEMVSVSVITTLIMHSDACPEKQNTSRLATNNIALTFSVCGCIHEHVETVVERQKFQST